MYEGIRIFVCVCCCVCVCLCWRFGGLLIVSAMPIIKKKTIKSEILIIWREREGKGRGSEG